MSTESTARHFIVIMEARSGSTYFVDLVRQHPRVVGRMETLQRWDTHEEQLAEIHQYFGNQLRRNPAAAVGFKTRIWHLHDPDALLPEVIDRYDPVFFVTRRPNYVRRIVSVLRGRQLREASGRQNLWEGLERPPAASIDLDDFDARLKNLTHREEVMEAAIERHSLNPIEIRYERLRYHPDEVAAEFFEAVGVEPLAGLESKVSKLTPDDLRLVVLNFDELVARYEGTPYYDMFFESG